MFKKGQQIRCVADYNAYANGYPRIGDIYEVLSDHARGDSTVYVQRQRDGWIGRLYPDRFELLCDNKGED